MSNGIDRFLRTSSFLSLFLSLSFLHRSFFLSFFLFFVVLQRRSSIRTAEKKTKDIKKSTHKKKVKHQSSCKLSVICLSTFYIYTKDSKENNAQKIISHQFMNRSFVKNNLRLTNLGNSSIYSNTDRQQAMLY